MNILCDTLQDFVEIEGRQYKIHTDFRRWIKFEIIMKECNIPPEIKLTQVLKLCYKELPPHLDCALAALVDFYRGGEITNPQNINQNKAVPSALPVYCFNHDSNLIYSAFYTQYGIDLQTAELHFWQFKALFSGLSNDMKIVQIMGYRGANLADIKDKEKKRFYMKMMARYKLPDMRSKEQKEQDMIGSLSKLF